MKALRTLFLSLCLVLFISEHIFAQAETVPTGHPVYRFLKRMDVKGLITRYRDAVLPLSRREIASHLLEVQKAIELTETEREIVTDYLSEFQLDIGGSIDGFLSVVGGTEPALGEALAEELSNKEKFFYALKDSVLTMFVNGLVTFDLRQISGDALGSQHADFVQFGGRIRGTIWNTLGYYLQGTNAQFWGSRNLLLRDVQLGNNYALLAATDVRNFDFSEGYVRYDGGIVTAQLGRERLLWGVGYDQKMVASENVRTFDFLRADLQYKSLKYTFLHGALLGRRGKLSFVDKTDSSSFYSEPIVADKFFAAHRIEFSFPRMLDIGFQEMAIYSNRSIDLAYVNPFIVLESTQRSREERDNVLWAFDIQTHFLRGAELNATIIFDDLHFSEFFEPRWYNRYAYQVGFMVTDPLFLPNMSLIVEYTRVKPFVFAHDRSRENSYTSLNSLLGPRIPPNSDSWFFSTNSSPFRNLNMSFSVTLARHGGNVYDPTGKLVRNVGGDVFQGHRSIDPLDAKFLDGNLFRSRTFQCIVSYEFINQMWLEGWFESETVENVHASQTVHNTTFGARVRTEL